jgi:DNA-binding transcriptional regulator YhcF (GntR family)
MEIHLNRYSMLSIKDQIKRQIRMFIESGTLPSGQPLPSAKDMACALNVNRNTVSNAYRELVSEGYLDAIVGKGTFVRENTVTATIDDLDVIFGDTFEKAVKSGFTRNQIEDFLLTRAIACLSNIRDRKVLVVECNREAIENISYTLRNELGVETLGLLIQEFNTNPELISKNVLSSVDLVVCGMNHIEEFQRLCPDSSIEIVGVMTRADVRIVNELRQLPHGTKVGFCCANQQSTETFFKESMQSGETGFIKIWMGLDSGDDLKKHLGQCRVIIANGQAYDRVTEIADAGQRVIRLESNIDRTNVDLIWERLIQIGKKRTKS